METAFHKVNVERIAIANSYSYSHSLSKETSRQLVLDMQPVVGGSIDRCYVTQEGTEKT